MQIHQFPTMGAPGANDLYLVSHDNTVFSVKHQTLVEAAGEQAKSLIADSRGTYTGNIDDIRENSMYWCTSGQGGATGTFPNSVYPEITGTSWQIETHSIYSSGSTLLQLAWYRGGKPYMFVRRFSIPSGSEEGTWNTWLMYADKDSVTSELTAIKNRLNALELVDTYTSTLANGITVDARRHGEMCTLYLHGTASTELVTRSDPITLCRLPDNFKPRINPLTYTWLAIGLFGQVRVTAAGDVTLGYTRKINTPVVVDTSGESSSVAIISPTNILQGSTVYCGYSYLADY